MASGLQTKVVQIGRNLVIEIIAFHAGQVILVADVALGPNSHGKMYRLAHRSGVACCLSAQIEQCGLPCTVTDHNDVRCELFAGARSRKRIYIRRILATH